MGRTIPKTISKEQAQAILAQPNPDCPTGLRSRVILEVMYRAGVRVSEVCNLGIGDIRWESAEIEIRHGKGGGERVVPVASDTASWLARWEHERPKKPGRGGYFFCSLKGNKLTTRYIRQMVDRCAEKAGIDRYTVSPHTFRHTYATEKLDDGFTVREVQELLGHSNIHTTSIYLHVNPKALREKIQGRFMERADAKQDDSLEHKIQELEKQIAQLREMASQR